MAKAKLSTEPYKGVRDFYPEDMFVQNYLFDIMRDTAESFGYDEYNASIFEPTSLYEAKTGEEIVTEQTYTFLDRARRSVTLRPEMTPTVARMVAAKKRHLAFPLRWYSIPNVFRYERPQRGRLREHWQLNVDLFGVTGMEAEIEIITLAYQLMKNFGASESNFEIRLSYAGMLESFLADEFKIGEKDTRALMRVIDKAEKISEEEFNSAVSGVLGADGKKKLASLDNNSEVKQRLRKRSEFSYCKEVARALSETGITDTAVLLNPFLVRGFEYYSGLVFEVFDTSPYNKRSLFGGGRYDHLLEIFGAEPVPAVGFGMGDVTLRDFLETHSLLPEYEPAADLFICTLDESKIPAARTLAHRLRVEGANVAVNITGKKVGDQVQYASKKAIPFIICVGDDEIARKKFALKNLVTGDETIVSETEIASHILSAYA